MKILKKQRRKAPHHGTSLPKTAPKRALVRRKATGPRPGEHEILFLPLGGCSRIGMNMALYGHAGKWLIVDAGVAFMGDEAPGIDSVMADPYFIEQRMQDVVGLVVTHGHEDHIGAIHHLWPRLSCPIYASPFATRLIRDRLKEAGSLGDVRLHSFQGGKEFKVGPFRIEPIAMTHSIPEPFGLAIRTNAGTVFHTGDWKFDPEPGVGQLADMEALKRLGDEGVLAMMCDSTNATVEGSTGSEAEARAGLAAAFAGRKGAIAVAGFASNIARMKAVALAAKANDRKVVLAGRSLLRMEAIARVSGYLDDIPPFMSLEEASWTDRRNLVLLCTGSQGEERAALSRIARDDHRELWLERGDTVIFSARAIPGNEAAIDEIRHHLTKRGIEVITPAEAPVHVSGHPRREDLQRMYRLIRPRFAVPVHGMPEHLEAHASLALSCGVEDATVVSDGDILRVGLDGTELVDRIKPRRLAFDGRALIPWTGPIVPEAEERKAAE
ncbi:ribonuclease J [Telmatospirillum sp. J64-1]|uniref:ribonuclease J n=1 Tax=Telmatospirillum sp. J64-1 TaxID=2502183 RepID=UPI00115CCEF2|nr:ribonuclease J [Telmatospirillum sp. J64-1]